MASTPLDPNLEQAIRTLLDRIDREFFRNYYFGPPIELFLVDGLAVNFYGGICDPPILDVSFERRVLLPWDDLREDYVRADGRPATLSLRPKDRPDRLLLHRDAIADAVEWTGIGNENRCLVLKVLTPLDVAVFKLTAAGPQDYADILSLIERCNIPVEDFRQRALGMLSECVGGTWVLAQIEAIAEQAAGRAGGKGSDAARMD